MAHAFSAIRFLIHYFPIIHTTNQTYDNRVRCHFGLTDSDL
jgi:hypothetical protein